MRKLVNLLIYLILLNLIFCLQLTNAKLPEKVLCVDLQCKKPISLARTKLNYQAAEKGVLSFRPNINVKIFSKEVGSGSMWGAEVQGRKGFLPKSAVVETRIFTNDLTEVSISHNFNKTPNDEKKLQSSESEINNKVSSSKDILETAMKTPPLPSTNESIDSIVTDQKDVNINTTEKLELIATVQKKIDVIDGTTVINAPTPQPSITTNSNNDQTSKQEEIPSEGDNDDISIETTNYDEGNEDDDENDEQEKEEEEEEEENEIAPNGEVVPDFKPLPSSSANFLNLAMESASLGDKNENKYPKPIQQYENIVENETKNNSEVNVGMEFNSKENTTSENQNKDQSIENDLNSDKKIESSIIESSTEIIENKTTDNQLNHNLNETDPSREKNGIEKLENEEDAESVEKLKKSLHNQTETKEDKIQNQTIELPKDSIEVVDLNQDNVIKNEEINTIVVKKLQNETEAKKENTKNLKNQTIEMPEDSSVKNLDHTQNVATETEQEIIEIQEENASKLENNQDSSDNYNQLRNETEQKENEASHNNSPNEFSSNLSDLIDNKLDFTPSAAKNNIEDELNNREVPENVNTIKTNLEKVTPDTTTPEYNANDFIPTYPDFDTTTISSQINSIENIRNDLNTENVESIQLNNPIESEQTAEMSQLENDDNIIKESIENVDETKSVSPIDLNKNHNAAEVPPETENHDTFGWNFFSSLLETVQNIWPNNEYVKPKEHFDESLEKILYPDKATQGDNKLTNSNDGDYCENLTPNVCPSRKSVQYSSGIRHPMVTPHNGEEVISSNSLDDNNCVFNSELFSMILNRMLENANVLILMGTTALTVLIFSFGHYCFSHNRKEHNLLSKLNIVERSLLASNKESQLLKHDLFETRNKLVSIEDNSFGSNDMVISLKKELEDAKSSELKLQEQVTSLEKELENAAEAGLELNKIVSELLNNQSGDDSIISSVEELQKQLNEQQNTILEINTTLAEKSRENSELQLLLADQAAKYQEEINLRKQQNDDLQNDKTLIESKFDDCRRQLEEQLSMAKEEKNAECMKLNQEFITLKVKYEEICQKWQKSDARVETLEECVRNLKKGSNINLKELMDVTNLKTDILSVKRERDSLKERLEGELDARKLLEDHVKIVSEEVSALKQEYNQSEKEKLEAQTRLEVLSSYFKEKETQLQKELSVKEAMWLKQQGETTSTVERVRLMQDEIQALKSQNDSLRAEIEAQSAAHKAQISSLENRTHETWLAARQSERRLEESRSEASALRRKLTSLAGNPQMNDNNIQNRVSNSVDGLTSNDLNNAPSPIHMESPGSPLLSGLPPPPPFLPPPFMPPPHPFMPLPPPFMSGEMRPPPLGRLMSPPPLHPHNRYSPSIVDDERDRYSPENGRYSPDSRYNYNTDIISTYETETDFSPPPSPQSRSVGGGYNNRDRERDRDRERERNRDRERERERNRNFKTYSPPPLSNSDRSKKSKGLLSSGSADSFDSRKGIPKGKV